MKGKITLFLLIIGLQLSAKQNPILSFKYFTKDNGLISAYINDIEQDSNGFIWAASKGGLNRIVGNEIVSYYYNINDSTSIPGSNILSIYNDSKGQLWVSGFEGLSIYNETLDNFTQISSTRNGRGLKEFDIIKFKEDKNHKLYLASSKRIYLYNNKERLFNEIAHIPYGNIQDFLITNNNQLWIGTDEHPALYIYDLNNSNKLLDNNKIINYKFDFITSFAQKDNRIYWGTQQNGIFSFTPVNKRLTHYLNEADDSNNIIFLNIDNDSNIWSCDYTGIKFFDEAKGTFHGYYPSDNHKSIKSNSKGIFQDSQGNYWVMHNPGGIGLSTKRKGFNNINNIPKESMYTSSLDCANVTSDKYGNLWIGSFGGTIDIYDKNHININRFQSGKNGLPKGSILYMGRSKNNDMLIGIYNAGIYRFNEKEKHFEKFNFNTIETLSNQDIRSIVIDENKYWLATHGKGVDCIENGKIKNYNTLNSKLTNDWTNQILRNYKGDIWVASSWGLSVLKKGDADFTPIYSSSEYNNGLADNHIVCLFEDNVNNLWIGTERGLCKYDYHNQNFKIFLNNEIICGITDDKEGNLWVSTNSHVFQLNTITEEYIKYNNLDGIQISEFIPKSVFHDSAKNEIFFGGIDGGVFFNPDELHYNTTPPIVYFTNFKILNREISYNENPQTISSSIQSASEITLKHYQNVFTLTYESNNFINPDKNLFSYKLEGFDKDWVQNGTKREVTYTNIEPGKYILKIKTKNNDGVWSQSPKELIINIIPPWYQRTVTHYSALGILIILMFVLIKIRTRHLEIQQNLLQKQVNDKTIKLVESNNELQTQAEYLSELNEKLEERQSKIENQANILKKQANNLSKANNELKILNDTKDRLFSIISHDLISPFNSILGLTELLNEESTLLNPSEHRLLAHKINSSAQRVYNLLQNLLIWSKTQTNSVVFNPETVILFRIISDALELLNEIIIDKKIKCKIEIPNTLLVLADANMLATIFRNIISNAIKFSPIGETITISANEIDDKVKIAIKDNGIGIPDDIAKGLFYEGHNITREGTAGEKGSGLGLQICKEFVHKNNGQIWTESEINKGTTFYFTLPSVK